MTEARMSFKFLKDTDSTSHEIAQEIVNAVRDRVAAAEPTYNGKGFAIAWKRAPLRSHSAIARMVNANADLPPGYYAKPAISASKLYPQQTVEFVQIYKGSFVNHVWAFFGGYNQYDPHLC